MAGALIGETFSDIGNLGIAMEVESGPAYKTHAL